MGAAHNITLPSVGQIGAIPLDLIQPFKGQPRTFFDPVSLQELAESIAAEGQRTPAWVMPKNSHFELIAGERRLRACRLANLPTLICEVRAPESAIEQYIDSVMENFGRQDCTALEAARAVAKVIQLRFANAKWGDKVDEQVAKIFAKSKAWVRQMRLLERLHPDVIAFLEPPQKIPTLVAISLARLSKENQVILAKNIVYKKMKFRTALSYIQSSHGSGTSTRRPSDDFAILARFLKNLGEQAHTMLSISDERIARMFASRSDEDIDLVLSMLDKRAVDLGRLRNKIQKAAK